MLKIEAQKQFKSDFKRIARSGGYSITDLLNPVAMLAANQILPKKYKDHSLLGEWKGFRECHIKPDWLLIYKIEPSKLILVRTGSHSELFK